MTRITFTNNLTGNTTRAILHREFEDGSLLISYMSEGGELRRYVSLAKWHYTGIALAPKVRKAVVMGEPAAEHVRDHYTAVLMSAHSTTMQRLWANAQLNLIFAAYEVC